jgi:RNA polymerase sigma factor (sigma-70 family)
MVLGVCRRVLGDEHAADDALQATFLVLARKAGTLDRRPSLANWLYTVAVRVARRARAQSAHRRSAEQRAEAISSSDPVDELTARELCAALDDVLDRLPGRYREPLVLCCVQGPSRDEAAHRLGWSLGAVKGRPERGRDLLRQRLARRGISLPADLGAGLLLSGPSVPSTLAGSTAQAAVAFVARTSGAQPPVAAQLARRALWSLTWSRWRVAVICLTLGLVGVGIGTAARRARPAVPPATPAANTPPAAASRDNRTGNPRPAGALARLGSHTLRHDP